MRLPWSAVSFFIKSSEEESLAKASYSIIGTGNVNAGEAFEVTFTPDFNESIWNFRTLEYFDCYSGTLTISGGGYSANISIDGKANRVNYETGEILERNVDVSLKYDGMISSFY